MSFFHTFNKSVAPPRPVFSPPRPVDVTLKDDKQLTDSQVLQGLVNLLQETNASTFTNREEYAREILREQD